MAQIIDGKAMGDQMLQAIALEIAALRDTGGVVPGLSTVLVGEDPASRRYVEQKEKACRRVGAVPRTVHLPSACSQAELLAEVERLNNDPAVHGIIVQLPLPAAIDPEAVLDSISPRKDVDGFHPENLGLLLRGRPRFIPCTPAGVLTILDSLPLDFTGRRAVVIGRSLIVGRPVALMLLQRHLTVTICHTQTADLAAECRTADLLVAAAGVPALVRGDWVKPGAVVIDVGTRLSAGGKLVGDVDFAAAAKRAAHITPVPGGVGRLTVAHLLANLLTAAKASRPTSS